MTFGASYFGQPYFGGAPVVVVVVVVVQMIPPTMAELADSGLNAVLLNSAGANVLTSVTDGEMVPVLVASGANQVEITD